VEERLIEGATIDTGRAAAPWIVWNRMPEPLRVPSRRLISLARRLNARGSKLPPGPLPLLPSSAVQLQTRYGGFWFDAQDAKVTPWIRREATWEQDVIRFLNSVVRPGMTAVDVGANIGFHTMVLSRLVGPLGAVHAFEPLPETLALLRANLWRHECANTTVHAAAVTDTVGTVEMQLDPEGRSGAHIGSGFAVPAVTLDEALAGVRVDVLKVDVEGAEPMVFRGARELIRRNPRITAVVEFRGGSHLDGSTPEQVLDLYEELGLRPHTLHADGRIGAADRAAVLDAAARAETLNIVLRA
jgi:FkbM family methyltransferase